MSNRYKMYSEQIRAVTQEVDILKAVITVFRVIIVSLLKLKMEYPIELGPDIYLCFTYDKAPEL